MCLCRTTSVYLSCSFVISALEVAPKFAVNQSRPEEITIKEDVGHINFITDDGFGKNHYS